MRARKAVCVEEGRRWRWKATGAGASVLAVGPESRELLRNVSVVQLAEAVLLLSAQVVDGRAHAAPRRGAALLGLLLDARLEVTPLAVQLVAEDGQETLQRVGHVCQGGGGGSRGERPRRRSSRCEGT